MKKSLSLLAGTMLLALSASAQTEKGTVLLGLSGGNFNYSRHDDNDFSKRSDWSASLYPTAGIFLTDNFLVGARLNLSYSHLSLETNGVAGLTKTKRSEAVYGLGPFARYYLPATGKHRLFAELGAGFAKHTFNQVDENVNNPQGESRNKSSYSSTNAYGALGYNYFFAPNAALEATVGYSRQNLGRYNSAGALDAHVGISIFLGKGSTTTAQP